MDKYDFSIEQVYFMIISKIKSILKNEQFKDCSLPILISIPSYYNDFQQSLLRCICRRSSIYFLL